METPPKTTKKSNSAENKIPDTETKKSPSPKTSSLCEQTRRRGGRKRKRNERLDANKKPTRRFSSRDRVRSSRIRQLAREIQTLRVRFRRRQSLELTEGDVLAILSQYGEIVDVFVPRDEKTGKSKGFAFVCYLDQRSTIIAVDNLNGSKVLGRILRVDHCEDYRLREEFNKKIFEMEVLVVRRR